MPIKIHFLYKRTIFFRFILTNFEGNADNHTNYICRLREVQCLLEWNSRIRLERNFQCIRSSLETYNLCGVGQSSEVLNTLKMLHRRKRTNICLRTRIKLLKTIRKFCIVDPAKIGVKCGQVFVFPRVKNDCDFK